MLESLHEEGAFVLPGYLTSEQARQLREQIDALFESRHEDVQVQGDERIFGIERLSAEFLRFNQDRTLARVARLFLGDVALVTTMANRLVAGTKKRSSGGGWHRDRLNKQFKVIVYLSDVTLENGPFCMLRDSTSTLSVLKDHRRMGCGPLARRYKEDEVNALLTVERSRQRKFVAPAGTAILFDSSAIHRGMPISSGSRYAMTNYYYEMQDASEQVRLEDKFKPLDGFSEVPSDGTPES